MDRVTGFLHSREGSMLTSVLLGFGLATMFRVSCVGEDCVIVRPPDMAQLRKHVYEMDGVCYKYDPVATKCS